MYFLWRTKPRAVLGTDKNWIPFNDLQKRAGEILALSTDEDARRLQRTEFPKDNISVLNRKTFLQKTKLKNMPVVKPVAFGTLQGPGQSDKPMLYNDYLDSLCATVSPTDNGAVFPPANLRETFDTPLIQRLTTLLEDVQQGITALTEEEQRLRDEIRQFDLLTSDFIHQLEMCIMSDEEYVTLAKNLRNSRIARRQRKNELAAVLLVKDLFQPVEKADAKDCLKAIHNLGKQEYHCRVLSDETIRKQKQEQRRTAG